MSTADELLLDDCANALQTTVQRLAAMASVDRSTITSVFRQAMKQDAASIESRNAIMNARRTGGKKTKSGSVGVDQDDFQMMSCVSIPSDILYLPHLAMVAYDPVRVLAYERQRVGNLKQGVRRHKDGTFDTLPNPLLQKTMARCLRAKVTFREETEKALAALEQQERAEEGVEVEGKEGGPVPTLPLKKDRMMEAEEHTRRERIQLQLQRNSQKYDRVVQVLKTVGILNHWLMNGEGPIEDPEAKEESRRRKEKDEQEALEDYIRTLEAEKEKSRMATADGSPHPSPSQSKQQADITAMLTEDDYENLAKDSHPLASLLVPITATTASASSSSAATSNGGSSDPLPAYNSQLLLGYIKQLGFLPSVLEGPTGGPSGTDASLVIKNMTESGSVGAEEQLVNDAALQRYCEKVEAARERYLPPLPSTTAARGSTSAEQSSNSNDFHLPADAFIEWLFVDAMEEAARNLLSGSAKEAVLKKERKKKRLATSMASVSAASGSEGGTEQSPTEPEEQPPEATETTDMNGESTAENGGAEGSGAREREEEELPQPAAKKAAKPPPSQQEANQAENADDEEEAAVVKETDLLSQGLDSDDTGTVTGDDDDSDDMTGSSDDDDDDDDVKLSVSETVGSDMVASSDDDKDSDDFSSSAMSKHTAEAQEIDDDHTADQQLKDALDSAEAPPSKPLKSAGPPARYEPATLKPRKATPPPAAAAANTKEQQPQEQLAKGPEVLAEEQEKDPLDLELIKSWGRALTTYFAVCERICMVDSEEEERDRLLEEQLEKGGGGAAMAAEVASPEPANPSAEAGEETGATTGTAKKSVVVVDDDLVIPEHLLAEKRLKPLLSTLRAVEQEKRFDVQAEEQDQFQATILQPWREQVVYEEKRNTTSKARDELLQELEDTKSPDHKVPLERNIFKNGAGSSSSQKNKKSVGDDVEVSYDDVEPIVSRSAMKAARRPTAPPGTMPPAAGEVQHGKPQETTSAETQHSKESAEREQDALLQKLQQENDAKLLQEQHKREQLEKQLEEMKRLLEEKQNRDEGQQAKVSANATTEPKAQESKDFGPVEEDAKGSQEAIEQQQRQLEREKLEELELQVLKEKEAHEKDAKKHEEEATQLKSELGKKHQELLALREELDRLRTTSKEKAEAASSPSPASTGEAAPAAAYKFEKESSVAKAKQQLEASEENKRAAHKEVVPPPAPAVDKEGAQQEVQQGANKEEPIAPTKPRKSHRPVSAARARQAAAAAASPTNAASEQPLPSSASKTSTEFQLFLEEIEQHYKHPSSGGATEAAPGWATKLNLSKIYPSITPDELEKLTKAFFLSMRNKTTSDDITKTLVLIDVLHCPNLNNRKAAELLLQLTGPMDNLRHFLFAEQPFIDGGAEDLVDDLFNVMERKVAKRATTKAIHTIEDVATGGASTATIDLKNKGLHDEDAARLQTALANQAAAISAISSSTGEDDKNTSAANKKKKKVTAVRTLNLANNRISDNCALKLVSELLLANNAKATLLTTLILDNNDDVSAETLELCKKVSAERKRRYLACGDPNEKSVRGKRE